MEPATGIFLHNRGVGFSLLEGHPAEVGPRRRPPHTLSPMLVTAAGRGADATSSAPWAATPSPRSWSSCWPGCCGPARTRRTAIAAPRMSLDAPAAGPFRLWWGEDLTVLAEADAPAGWVEGLARARAPGPGHPGLRPGRGRLRPDHRGDLASPGPSHFVGASDPRSPEGAAAGR